MSLFAQELRTPQPVSVKRLEKAWAQVALEGLDVGVDAVASGDLARAGIDARPAGYNRARSGRSAAW